MEMILNSEAIFPKISSSSSIADLMKFLRRDLNEVQSILTARENDMKVKIENLEMSQRECGILTEEIARLNQERRALNERMKKREEEYTNSFELLDEKISRLIEGEKKSVEENKRMGACYAELQAAYLHKTSEMDEVIYKLNETMNELNSQNFEKLKLVEKLQMSQREHDKSKEEFVRLIEDHRREKNRILEHFDEYLKNREEKDGMILQLNNKIEELENQILESERTAEMYKVEVESSNLMIGQKNGEIEELKQRKSQADQVVEELRCKEEKYEKSFEELNEKLHASQREHKKSKEEIMRLIEDHRREKKRILEGYDKIFDKYLKNKEEKDEMILKIEELENQILESEHNAEMYSLEVKSSDFMVAHMIEEVEELKQQKSKADEVVEELRCKLLEADQNLQQYRQRFETLNSMVEHDLANALNANVNDLRNRANDLEKKSAIANEDDAVHVPSSGHENENLGGGENDDLENHDSEHPRDESNLKNCTAADDRSSMVVSAHQTSGNEMNISPLRGQCAINTILDHSELAKNHLEIAGCSREMGKSFERVDIIIKIDDSEDEVTEPEGSFVSLTAKRKRSTNGSENNETSSIGVHKEKRRQGLISDGPESFMNDSFLKSIRVAVDQPFHGIASTDSDNESITSSCIEEIIGSL